jgi:hypothetical protein
VRKSRRKEICGEEKKGRTCCRGRVHLLWKKGMDSKEGTAHMLTCAGRKSPRKLSALNAERTARILEEEGVIF